MLYPRCDDPRCPLKRTEYSGSLSAGRLVFLTRLPYNGVQARLDANTPKKDGSVSVVPTARMGAEVSMVVDGWQGRFLEDFKTGDVYRSRIGRTVTQTENIQFTLLTNNTNQIHFNADYGEKSGFGGCLINSLLTIAIVAGLSVPDVSENGIALGWDEIKLPNPVRPDDTLYSESEVLEVRESRSRPGQGILSVRTRGYNQRGEVVVEMRRSVLVWKREYAPVHGIFPVRSALPNA
jgi:itaconyl-CoA hydratase